MKKSPICLFCAFLCVALLNSCSTVERDFVPNRRVMVFYAAAFNNLSDSIIKNIDDFCNGQLPAVGNDDVFLVYAHTTSRYGVYTPTNPVLFRAYRGPEGQLRRDTLIVYPDTDVSSTAEVLNNVLNDVRDKFPARSYGLLFSSHAKGWVPVGYKEQSTSLFGTGGVHPEYPLTKELGTENATGSGIDIRDLPAALPMHLDFFIMDACLMGCVEVAYELRDKCDLLLFSPTEILAAGMPYKTMPEKLLDIASPDLEGIAREYYEMYEAESGLYKSATITLVDCRKTEALAQVVGEIIAAHRTGFDNAPRSQVQPYFYNDFHWFYDLRDLLVKSGATDAELARLDKALGDCVLYKAATEKFFNLKLDSVCGLSVYFPIPGNTVLNNYYKTLSWNKATGIIL